VKMLDLNDTQAAVDTAAAALEGGAAQ